MAIKTLREKENITANHCYRMRLQYEAVICILLQYDIWVSAFKCVLQPVDAGCPQDKIWTSLAAIRRNPEAVGGETSGPLRCLPSWVSLDWGHFHNKSFLNWGLHTFKVIFSNDSTTWSSTGKPEWIKKFYFKMSLQHDRELVAFHSREKKGPGRQIPVTVRAFSFHTMSLRVSRTGLF